MKKLIGLKGGENGSFFEILDSQKVDNLERFPSIKNGVEVPYPFAGTDEEVEEYFDNKQKVTYLGYRLTVAGNPVCAESALKEMGYTASASTTNTVDIFMEQSHGGPREGAGRPATGRKRQNFYITDDEDIKLRAYLEELRGTQNGQ